MSRVKQPWHQGSYHRLSRALTAAARANPLTTCWRCGLLLQQHRPHKNGKPAQWTAGHVITGLVDGPLAPEGSTCNSSAGATHGNLLRKPRRTRLTW